VDRGRSTSHFNGAGHEFAVAVIGLAHLVFASHCVVSSLALWACLIKTVESDGVMTAPGFSVTAGGSIALGDQVSRMLVFMRVCGEF